MQRGKIAEIDKDGCLICPNCDGFNMHQGQVIVEAREREDGVATRTVCNGKHVAGRRNNIYITFSCEDCSIPEDEYGQQVPEREFTLVIQQHKGPTYLKWI